eukprot:TRINITY_DN2737_c1_g1_i4.p1 TRINITY_DN2737_c1_g1~~TRINITY_DN2737_c1_g1_i4.p1  ORF type:complete len:118 (-),score=23.58 TRINITY_DN2737_c1_g1_i4:342-695(-)
MYSLCSAIVQIVKKKPKHKTKTISGTCNPVWGEIFTFTGLNLGFDIVYVEVWDKDRAGSDDLLGTLHFPIVRLQNQPKQDLWLPLAHPKRAPKGQIHLILEYQGPGSMCGYPLVSIP